MTVWLKEFGFGLLFSFVLSNGDDFAVVFRKRFE